ncbi:MAG: TetR/AcrR family transcriptional regulator [Acidobacteria bacterium]|nr:TetR/AcrR family transcriptional regulator [Acidobacteriota bacterium]
MTDAPSTQDRIREAAVGLLAARGYGGTSMADIAEQVGISKAGLYNYYRSKEELLVELLERSLEAWKEASFSALGGSDSAEECLRLHLEACLAFTAEHPATVAVIRVAASLIDGDLGHRVNQAVATYKNEYQQSLEGFFASALARGEIVGAEPSDLAFTWRSFLDGCLRELIFRQPTAADPQDRLPQLWRILWRGLSGKP